MLTLRDYQQETVEKCIKFTQDPNNKGVGGLVVAPVSSGKSLIISKLAHSLKGKTVVLQPSVELLQQNLEKLRLLGGEASIFSAKAGTKEMGDITYATIGSVYKLAKDFKKHGVVNVILDECENYPPKKGSMFRQFVDIIKPKVLIGFTATPCRLYSMGNREDNYSILNFITRKVGHEHPFLKKVITVIQVKELSKKYWTPLNYELYDFDEGTLKMNSTGSEFTEESIKNAIKEQGINNSIYKRIKQLNKEGFKAILTFCDCLESAEKFAKILPNSAYISGETPPKIREQLIKDFKEGKIWNMFNYGTLTAGFDYPNLRVVIMGRPTTSYRIYYQINGRSVRQHPDKKEALFIDYCNNVKRFGKLESLHIEDIKGFGWGMFSDNRLLTNIRMDVTPLTLQELKGEIDKSKPYVSSGIKFWFGKHNGAEPKDVPTKYLSWIIENYNSKTIESNELIRECRKVVNYRNSK